MGSSGQDAAAAARSASDQSGLLGWGRRLGSPLPLCLLPEVARAAPVSPAVRLTRRRPCLDPARLLDRKSTRLNSSHVEISYAVFCLKKKKNTPHLHNYYKNKHIHAT